jgi:hypothetical protein
MELDLDSRRWNPLFVVLAAREPPCRLERSDGGERPKNRRGSEAPLPWSAALHRGEAIDFKFGDPES